ncbi:MAG: molybdopterin-binding protein [Pseudomonadota bacterium]
MTRFDTVIVVDWSGGNDTGARPRADAIWAGVVRDGVEDEPRYFRNRPAVEAWLQSTLNDELAAGRRILAGFDFAFGYPDGTARTITGQDDPFALWDWFAEELDDTPGRNNRFQLAGRINALFPGDGPFWFNATKDTVPGLPRRKSDRSAHYQNEALRRTETRAAGAFPVWQLGGAGAVGSQAMTGMAALARLRKILAGQVCVWPFQAPEAPVVFAEVFPSLLRDQVRAVLDAEPHAIKDAVQVRLLAWALARLSENGALKDAFAAARGPAAEGWILGVGAEQALIEAARPKLSPPRLKDDCFALPPGVDWVPVDHALALLQGALSPVVEDEALKVSEAIGRVLAKDHLALRSNPPLPNVAVDGYGFAHAAIWQGPQILPLHPGRAAAGAVFEGHVPQGCALRVLTGAVVPDGVDTVVLEEDVAVKDGHIAFQGPVKPGANTRKAGEDVAEGDQALPAGRSLEPQDLALLTALGFGEVSVRKPLRVGVLSTGDELAEAGTQIGPDRIFDANRPMLLSLASRWGYRPVDLGIARDDRDLVRAALDHAATQCDAILTSGGASAGDEDHISAILREEGHVEAWRIALKPGRPLMLGLWRDVPVFGMPGNPVAAFVCALIFARPALSVLSGQGWVKPQGFEVPAGFTKRKKPGRREYLRARIGPDGQAEVFRSEGSGRISGLSWADGLVELDDGPRNIAPGDPVRYLPFGSFGL